MRFWFIYIYTTKTNLDGSQGLAATQELLAQSFNTEFSGLNWNIKLAFWKDSTSPFSKYFPETKFYFRKSEKKVLLEAANGLVL